MSFTAQVHYLMMAYLEPEHTAFIFPGQGSQAVGMGRALSEIYPIANQLFIKTDQELNLPLSQLAWQGPEDELSDTINTQPIILTHSIAVLSVFKQLYPQFQPLCVAGHSLGEFSALVASNALSFVETLHLVRQRGELMKQAGELKPGCMAAIFGLEINLLEQLCSKASIPPEIIQVANDNCPEQIVVSGTIAAMDQLLELAQKAGARKMKRLAVSIASHSLLMEKIQNNFNRLLQGVQLKAPKVPIVGNVSARELTSIEQIRTELSQQLTSRVRWRESVLRMIQMGVRTFVEMGNGKVLSGLIKNINDQVETISIGNPEDFAKISAPLFAV